MGPHVKTMKTTIELADPLLDEARRRAQRDGTPLRALVEQGLRPVIAPKRRGAAFRRRDASSYFRQLNAPEWAVMRCAGKAEPGHKAP